MPLLIKVKMIEVKSLCAGCFKALSLLLACVCAYSPLVNAEISQYTLSKQYGTVIFKVLQEDYLYLVGRFDDFGGTLFFDPEDLSATNLSANVVMNSLDLADSSVVELLTSSSVWFNTSLYSESTFTTDSVEVIGENTVAIHGQLTFVGVSQPWTLVATFHGGKDGSLAGSTVGMTATGEFQRSAFGVDQYTNVAADDITIEVNVKFNQN